MSRVPKHRLRGFEEYEKQELAKVSRSYTEPSIRVARAKALLAVSLGKTYREAATISGRKSDQAVSHLVDRFNERGLSALDSLHGGGTPIKYGPQEKQLILDCIARKPTLKEDGTLEWSLKALQAHLEKTSLGRVSTNTIWKVLKDADYSFQQDQKWITTGKAIRKRKNETVEVKDPDAEVKKN